LVVPFAYLKFMFLGPARLEAGGGLMRKLNVVVAFPSVILIGCATIMHGTRQDVSISSTPSAAAVTVDGQERGKTPVSVELSRKDKHLIKIELVGYAPFEMYLTKKVSGWVWGNLIFGGIPGLAVDAITGGLYELKPEQVTASMAQASISTTKEGIYIATVLRPDPTWRKIAQLQPVAHSLPGR
jgi:hypothetical protein